MIARHIIRRHILLACGWLALGLGAVGMFVPILPTAPLVLLAAACFMRSSESLHAWLVEHPRFGPHISDYLAGRGIRRRAKVLAVVTLWASVALSSAYLVPVPFARVAIVVIAAAVTVYLLAMPTCPS